MIEKKRTFYAGLGLLIGFMVVLVSFFSPIWDGKDGLEYLDNLYNSISKGSAYYIPKIREEAESLKGKRVELTLDMADERHAEQASLLLEAGEAVVVLAGARLNVEGDLGHILANCLSDADAMYHNEGPQISAKYHCDERLAMYNWWLALKGAEKDLKKQNKFKEAKVVDLIVKKAVETSYNYYQIDPQKITDRLGIVIFSLVFYVIYTVWYGFAIMFLFEGWGLRLAH
jgi:hypothetical protein